MVVTSEKYYWTIAPRMQKYTELLENVTELAGNSKKTIFAKPADWLVLFFFFPCFYWLIRYHIVRHKTMKNLTTGFDYATDRKKSIIKVSDNL